MNRLIFPIVVSSIGLIVLWGILSNAIPVQIRWLLIILQFIVMAVQFLTVRSSSETQEVK